MKIDSKVFKWFYEINQIPRCSGQEEKISNFLVKFAKDRNLQVIQDDALNVLIKKSASYGYENSPAVIIQGHMDMVCVKSKESEHDFSKDPIEMKVEGDFLSANETSLGGDDGIALAYGLAILDGDYRHPDLEVLFTTSEETNMKGAMAIKEGLLKGKTLLNIDSEEEGIFLTSCAGGITVYTCFDIDEKKINSDNFLEISISGLLGGHSGMEIIKERGNANKIMFRLFNHLRKEEGFRISKIHGGPKHNAIANESKAVIFLEDLDSGLKALEDYSKIVKEELSLTDPDVKIDFKKVQGDRILSEELTDNLIDYGILVPDGVVSRSKNIENLVQTSLNNAIVEEAQGQIKITCSVRSSVESEMNYILDVLKVVADKCKAVMITTDGYPAWEYEQNSRVRDLCIGLYEELFHEKGEAAAVHAGLECGILKKVLPDTDMISFGPNMYDVHSAKERISISSTERIFDFIVKLLEELK